jgi:predicted acyl esterase
VSAPTAELTSALGPAGQLVLFAKIYDVAPDGTASPIHGLVAPIRIPDPTRTVRTTLPGIAHRFVAGHRIEVILPGGDVNYRDGLTSTRSPSLPGRAARRSPCPSSLTGHFHRRWTKIRPKLSESFSTR